MNSKFWGFLSCLCVDFEQILPWVVLNKYCLEWFWTNIAYDEEILRLCVGIFSVGTWLCGLGCSASQGCGLILVWWCSGYDFWECVDEIWWSLMALVMTVVVEFWGSAGLYLGLGSGSAGFGICLYVFVFDRLSGMVRFWSSASLTDAGWGFCFSRVEANSRLRL